MLHVEGRNNFFSRQECRDINSFRTLSDWELNFEVGKYQIKNYLNRKIIKYKYKSQSSYDIYRAILCTFF